MKMKEGMVYDTNYYQIREMNLYRMKEIIDLNKESKPGGTLFYGDSLTELCDLKKYYPEIDNIINSGMCGITIDLLLNFVDEGVLKFKPSKVIIMAGTNDLGETTNRSPRDIALLMKDLCEIIHYNLPGCTLYLCSCLPCLRHEEYKYGGRGIRSNEILKMIFDEYQKIIRYEYVTLINVFDVLIEDGKVIEEAYRDGLHVNDYGYKLIHDVIKKEILKG